MKGLKLLFFFQGIYILGPNWASKTIETLSKATQIRDRQEKMSVGKKLGPM